ncbi:hypothetical protein EVAR_66892_1 [Eumeta japonica]|uniref:Uncharacterized protein n=1 Tax=Eumeta variegata TaxID=151549 RepID=A0A4C1ZYW0_EUMVA|nr:hypothetical protein EVAR_66892_1 [Eumeta japonica]
MQEISNRRLVLKRIIDIILFISKQGITYRGKSEALYSLTDIGRQPESRKLLNLVVLLSKYDPVLKAHMSEASNTESKKKRLRKVKQEIVKEIQAAKSFSLNVDSCQDVGVVDQAAICVPMLSGIPQERMLSMVPVRKSTGEDYRALQHKQDSDSQSDEENDEDVLDLDQAAKDAMCFSGSGLDSLASGLRSATRALPAQSDPTSIQQKNQISITYKDSNLKPKIKQGVTVELKGLREEQTNYSNKHTKRPDNFEINEKVSHKVTHRQWEEARVVEKPEGLPRSVIIQTDQGQILHRNFNHLHKTQADVTSNRVVVPETKYADESAVRQVPAQEQLPAVPKSLPA